MFGHAAETSERANSPLSPTTRYMAGAAYLDEKYAGKVIDGLVGQSHRAVVPALGYDIAAIARHCLRAQRLWLGQNTLIIAVLLLGAGFFATTATAAIYLFCLAIYVARSRSRQEDKPAAPNWKVIAGIVVALVVLVMFYLVPPLSDMWPHGDLVELALSLLIVAGALILVLAWTRYRVIGVLTGELAPGHPARAGRAEAREVEHRLGVIEAAQDGNVLLHSGFEPFVGAGDRVNAWSIATELQAEQPSDSQERKPPRRVDVDPVELARHLRDRLAELCSADLPAFARVPGLQLRDLIVSSGTGGADSPLIDERTRLPYSFAERGTVDSIIRAPQASARHFLRVTARAGAEGHAIMPAERQSVISSAFIHIAVEGGMLYVELVATVLGPMRQRYLAIDRYAASEDRLAVAIREAFRRALDDVAVAPWRLIRAAYRRLTLVGAIHRADREARDFPAYDFGSRLDVRHLASRPTYASYMQRLDAEKYTRLIDRRATEAIHEFLVENGVDDSDFVAKVNFNQYNNTVIAGDAHGPIANGTGANATMTSANAAAAAGSKPKGRTQ